MNSFAKRNAPVFIIGFITLIFFVVIIIFSLNKQPESSLPSLIKVEETEEEIADDFSPTIKPVEPAEIEDDPLDNPAYTKADREADARAEEFLESVTHTQTEVDELYGILEISFTEDGFEPKNATGYRDQLVKWTNNSDRTIIMSQTIPKYDEWKTNVTIQPGGTHEFRMYKLNLWTYMETESLKLGSVFASRPYK